jgi:OOP family OmpA-OmpF porin
MAILGFLAAAVAGPAAAQDKGVYVGGSFGAVVYEESCANLPRPCDDHDGGWRVFGGYQFSRHFAAELAYANLGRVESVGGDRDTKSADLSGIVSFPVAGGLSIFGRLGGYYARTKFSAGGSDAGGGFTYGAGLGFDLGKILGLRAEWQRWANVGGAGAGEDTIDLFSIGALVRF